MAPSAPTRTRRPVEGRLGGRRVTWCALRDSLSRTGLRDATVLDVGSGAGDLLRYARVQATRWRASLTVVGLDIAPVMARAAQRSGALAICGDALRLPLADRSVDIVLCSQLLHHFPDEQARVLLRELDRVARHEVIISELRRSWLAACGFWCLATAMRFHPVSRHDGFVSVLRGFATGELSALIDGAVGHQAVVTRQRGWRVVASWRPRPPTMSCR